MAEYNDKSVLPKATSITVELGEGIAPLKFETGKMARLANGAVTVTVGETIVFASACASAKADPEIDFFPLRVDYQEKFSAAGKSLGGFIKRENRPTEREILICRLIDRPIRPMFPEGYFNEVQLISYILSYDGINTAEPLAICAASAALVISDIPLVEPVAAVRMGLVEGKFIVNPTLKQQAESKLDLVLAGTEGAILMIEGNCDFLTEEQVLQSIELGHAAIKKICVGLSSWGKKVGKEKNAAGLRTRDEKLKKELSDLISEKISQALRIASKHERRDALESAQESAKKHFFPEGLEAKCSKVAYNTEIKELKTELMRKMILNEKVRLDGRGMKDIRPITIEMNPLPRTHGSALFTRGETQSLAVCTLGSPSMGQRFETLDDPDGVRSFYLHYSFPPFSVGEVGRVGGASRREVGHGKLAENSLEKILPSKDKFPYTIRLESNILESNGSSSMASVCGGCLAMMQAGVPIKKPIAGIAMGLIVNGDKYAILSDILGDEDALGDMDFKITGNEDGITAFQLDIKVGGISKEIMASALSQAKEGRLHILNKMLEVKNKPNEDLSVYAPHLGMIKIDVSKIGTVVGPGGKMIRKIQEETGAKLDIADDGTVTVCADSKESMRSAIDIVAGLTAEAEVGKIYEGKVSDFKDFGLFVEILPGKDGLVHISELANERISDIEQWIKDNNITEGSKIKVLVKSVDVASGKISLSHKACLPQTN